MKRHILYSLYIAVLLALLYFAHVTTDNSAVRTITTTLYAFFIAYYYHITILLMTVSILSSR